MLSDFPIYATPAGLTEAVQAAIDIKTKPPGSLGRIERLAVQLAVAQGTKEPAADPAHLFIFAGDHGLVAEGVSAWPQEVTAQMVQNFLSGGAAANVFARTNGIGLTVANAGVASSLPDMSGLIHAGIRMGTRNALTEDAMTLKECDAALRFGAGLAQGKIAEGAKVIAIGEMGIGNTASASLLAHAIDGLDLATLTGPGAGLDTAGVSRKLDILTRTAARKPGPLSPMDALSAFGGLEIAAMAGAAIAAASGKATVVVDGFISTSAAMVALRARPEIAAHLVFAHRSHEPGHRAMLDSMCVEPLLDLDLRLGEGTGALLALPLLRAACAMLAEMATFEAAGVSGKD
ncbi:MAG: nicotinate-nucleotide--dimethylbenzimidazole phosphoribosyltransferase [Pseudomonadota bacterium]